MGDNQLSILIQARIDKASTQTMQSQLDTLAKNLKSVKISLDLGDVKAQFAKMFQEIEKESQKQKVKAGGLTQANSTNFNASSIDGALGKAKSLDEEMQSVLQKAKQLGEIKSITETFSSADGSLRKLNVQVEELDNGLKKIKTVSVIQKLSEDGQKAVYELGEIKVKTQEVDAMLRSAGKDNGLYETMQKAKSGAIDAIQYAKELETIMYRYGNEKNGLTKSFSNLDTSAQKAWIQEYENAKVESLKRIQAQEEAQAKAEKARADEKAKALAEEAKLYEQIGAKREKAELSSQKQKVNEEKAQAEAINKELERQYEIRQKTLELEKLIDTARKSAVSNISNAKSQYSGYINEDELRRIQLGFNNLSVDTKEYTTDLKAVETQLKQLEKAYAQIEKEAKSAMALDQKLKAKAQEKQENGELNAQIKLEEDIANRRINLIDFEIQKREEQARLFSASLQAQMQAQVKAEQAEKQNAQAMEKANKELVERDTLYTKITTQMQELQSFGANNKNVNTGNLTSIISQYDQLRANIQNGNITLQQARVEYANLGAQMKQLKQETQSLTTTSSSLFSTFKMLLGVSSLFDIFNLGKRAIKEMISEVKTLDTALVELNKVSNLSDTQLNAYVNTAFKVSEAVGRLGSDVVNATSDFVQMGYSVEESAKLAENALMYVNVGDLGSVDDATSAMISTMKAFGIEADNSLSIIDKINNMSNNFAIDAKGIGEGLKRASSALASANNDIDETLAMMAVGNQVVQDPESLANGLKTISMRIRGLSEDGEELESNMEEVFATYANGVKVLNEDGSFRSTFDILNDLGKEWDTLTDKQQAYLAETVAGKHRANIFLSLMQNAKDLEDALETSQNSANSAMMENASFMDSIEGKTQQLKTAWQQLSVSVISSDFVKGVVDAITAITKFLADGEKLKILVIALTTAFTALTMVKIHSWLTRLSIISKVASWFSTLSAVMVQAQAGTIGLAGALSLLNLNPVVLAITALTAVVTGFAMASSKAKQKAEELAEANRQLAEESSQTVESINDISERYQALYDPVTQTITNKEELLKIQNDLKDSFGDEAEGIDLINGKYDETLAKLNELTLAKLKQNEVFLREAYDDAKEEAGNAINGGQIQFRVDYDNTKGELKRIIGEMQKEFSDVFKVSTINGNDFFHLDTTNIKEAEKVWTSLMSKMQDADIDKTNSTYQKVMETFQNATTASENLSKAQDDLYNNLAQSAVKTAMAEASCVDLKNATEEEIKSIQNFVKELKITDPVLADYTQKLLEASNQDFSTFTKANAEALRVYNTAITETKTAMSSAMTDVEMLDSAITTLTNNQTLSGDTINQLISKYSELQDSLTKTDKGYTLSKEALIALRQSKVDEANTTAQTQKNNVTNTINGVKARLTAYKQEVSAIKTLAQAQQALAGAKAKSTELASEEKSLLEDRTNNIANGRGWLNSATDTLKLNAIQNKKEENDKAIVEYESLVEGYKTLEELDKQIQAMDINATNSFISATSPSSSSKSKSSSSNKKSYIAQELDVLIDDILSSTEKLEYAIEFANEKLTTAQNKGDLETQNAIKQQIIDLIKQRKAETEKQAERLRAEGEKMVSVLSGTGLFNGIDLKNLTEKQLSDVSKILEKKIASSTDSQAEDLELLKSKIEEYGKAIIRIYSDELPSLSKSWWEIHNEYIEKMQESIEDTYNLAKKKIDDSNRDIELQQILLEEGSKEYMELEKKKYQNVLALQEEARQALKKIKEEDKNLEGELAQEYLEIWYDAEKEKREMIKAFAEQAMEDRKKEIEQQTKDLTEAQEALNDLLEATIKLIKQEYNDRKEALQDEIDAYQELINKKKASLQADKQARDDAKELKEKQTTVSKIEAQIAELQFDTSAQATAKRLELEEQLAEAREELEDFQYEQSLEKQEEALDEEYERFKELKDKQIKEIEDFLSKEGNLRAEALKLIESGNKELYDKLIQWNQDYGTGVSEDITNAWDLAYDAMESYNGGQMNVLETLSKITAEMERLNDLSENMKVEDFIDDSDGGMTGDIQDNPDTPSENHGNTISEEEAKKQEQLNQQKYLHEQAKKAKAEGNDALLRWVQAERKKWGLDPTSGAITSEGVVPADVWATAKKKYNIYHTGGFVGDLASNEEFAKLLKGEYVATEQQMQQFMNKTLPSITGIQSPTQSLNFENLINLRVDGNLDSSILPELESIIEKSINGAIGKINETMISRGFRRTGMSLGI